MINIKKFLLYFIDKLKKIFIFIKSKPYISFFLVVYGCLLIKFYTNQKSNNLYKEEKLLKSHKEQLKKLELEYEQVIYEYLNKEE